MANPLPNSIRQPLTKDDLKDDLAPLAIPDDTIQLQVDTLNVYQGLVQMGSFTEERQIQIRNYYRFSATRMYSDTPKCAPRTIDTLDLL